ncbi:MAG: LysR family transcriptional regulator [Chloroflexi bacterium]|nr:LysR family transcriptional regulator [Chloroflexota bacterium]
MPDLHQLRVFAAVVENGSYTRAAEQLFLTQPAVSAQMTRLHAFVRLPILAREGRGVKPTEAGLALYRYAQQVLAATDSLHRQVTEIASGEIDHVVVGANASYGTFVLPAALARIQLAHPGLRMSLVQGLNRDIIRQVRSGTTDLAVVFSEQVPEELLVENLGSDSTILVEAGSDPFSRGEPLDLAGVVRFPFIRSNMSGPNLTFALDRLLAQHGLGHTRTVMDLPTWTAAREAARTGVGIAIAYRSIVQPDLDNGDLRVVELEHYHDDRHVLLICSSERRRAEAPAFQEVLSSIREHMIRALAQAHRSVGHPSRSHK